MASRQPSIEAQMRLLEQLVRIGTRHLFEQQQRERTTALIREELATRFQEEALQKLTTARTKVKELQDDPSKAAQHEQKLAQLLIDIRAVVSMIVKVQETRLQMVVTADICTPAKLAQYKEERESVFKVVEKIENDVKMIVEQKQISAVEKTEE